MKKLILSLIVSVMTIGAMNAGQNKSITDARIYINPGHGSWTGNDRNMTTINHKSGDTTGFYESNTNLWKGLKLRQTLIDWGMPEANILMSRVKNGPYPHTDAEAEKYNRNLTEIAQEANSFNSDYFLSIHSDAGTANHTLLIHKGYSTPAEDPYMNHGNKYSAKDLMQLCSDMCYTTWPILTSNGIDVMNASYMQPGKKPYIYGDFTFYYGWTSPSQNTGKSGYLGVLRANTCPGFLSEGYSHEYYPATHRALNPDYCGQEGVRYARGIAEWFGWEKDPKGYIMGAVKDCHTHLEHAYYNYAKGSIDQWMPINNIEVVLYKGGVEIATYKGDDEWNGVFVFEKLEPGDDYTIKVVAPEYKSNFELDEEYGRANEVYSVKANETTYPIIYLERSDYEPYPCYNYPNPDQEKWIGVAGKYEMRQDYINKPIAALEGKTIRKEIAHGDSIYVLALDADKNPYIYIVNARTQELYKELSTTGVGDVNDERELMKISDIAFTSDSILVACNLEHMSFGTSGVTGTFRVYKWAKDVTTRTPTGDPEIWFTSISNNAVGNFSNATSGQSLTISGRLENCKVITTAQTHGTSGELRFPIYTITRKGLVETIRNQDKTAFSTKLVGEDYRIVVSPRDDNAIVIDGANITPTEYTLNTADLGAPAKVGAMKSDLLPMGLGGATFFKYGKRALMVSPKADANGSIIGVELYDVHDGFDKARLIETTNTEIAAVESAYIMASSHVEADDITIYLNTDNVVSRFTTQDVEQTYYNNVYAYDLKVAIVDGIYKFSFKANEDCLNGGKLKFYDATTGDFVGEITFDNVLAGANEKDVVATELPGVQGQVLNWSVEVSSFNVTHIRPLVEKEGEYLLNRAYATVNKYPETENFGHIYVSNYTGANKVANGIYVYNNELLRMNETAYNGGSTFNKNGALTVDLDGDVFVTDAGVSNSGLWTTSANQLETSFSQFFGGERSSSGVFMTGTKEIGGISTSVSLYGEGSERKMYVVCKTASGAYVVNQYNVGTETRTWNAEPTKVYSLPTDMKDDITVVAVEQGIWVAQAVTSVYNSVNSPCLIFINNEGERTFNAGAPENISLLSGVAGSSITVSSDEKTLVANDENGILQFFDIEWNGSTPILTHKYSYEHGIGVNAKQIRDGVCVEQMTFDYAGRLVASGRYLGVFTIPTVDNTCETPARSWMTVTCGNASVAIENVETDANAPVEYYNLQGVKVANPTNGIFIKKQGSKATKVIL